VSRIAERTGIGRATLCKYFPDVEAIVAAWHERQAHSHVQQLATLRDLTGSAAERLEAVLQAYARIQHEHRHESELAALLHRRPHVAQAQRHLRGLVAGLVAQGAAGGELRDDVSPDELAGFCLSALASAVDLPSQTAVRRLVDVTLAGLRPLD